MTVTDIKPKVWTRIKRTELHRVRAQLKDLQGNKCALCNGDFDAYTYHQRKRKTVKKYTPCLDHDHDSGAIRGVLCSYCNAVEGKIKAAIRRYHPYLKDNDEDMRDFLYQLGNYLNHHQINRTGRLHPDHLTPEEKVLKANRKRRAAYKRKKLNESDELGTKSNQGQATGKAVSDTRVTKDRARIPNSIRANNPEPTDQ